jgi:transcriptional regulator with XRE-family HTH domain
LRIQKPILECASALGLETAEYEKYELGEKAISLPELEVLSFFLQVPLDRFWEKGPRAAEAGQTIKADTKTMLRIRHRMVGAILKQARLESGLAREDLAKNLDLEPELLEVYELGLEPIPLPVLESLSGILNRSIREFQDQKGPIGIWNLRQQALRDFMEMPVEMQAFISKPINRPYLDLAVRLSEMSVDRLRAVAEGLLEITY